MSKNNNSVSLNTIVILITAAVLIIGFSLYSIYYLDQGLKPQPTKSILNFGKEVTIGGRYKLNGTDGKIYTEENLEGKISLIYFGFSYCPDICPTTMQLITNALDDLPKSLLNNVQVFFVTLDPERDNIEQLKSFVGNFHSNVIGLTGNPEDIKKMADSYKVFYNKVKIANENEDNNYNLDHSSIIYLMGKDGEYLKHFTSEISSQEISRELLKLLAVK